MTRIRVVNPSNEPRGGLVEIRVKTPVAALQSGFAVEDRRGRRLQSQLDVIDPGDRSRDLLVLRLRDEIEPNGSVLLDVVGDTPPPYTPTVDDPRVAKIGTHGVKLINGLLDIYISLVPEYVAGSPFYSGAATSVNVTLENPRRRQEFLDAINLFEAHDLQKRCMQIDSVQLSHPAGDPLQIQHEWLTNKTYEVVAEAQGPLRATITIATEFAYGTAKCRLHRALSIDRDDAVVERVYVREGTRDLYFTARYFAYMDMGLDIVPVHYRHIPDWLSLGCEWAPQHGYGFCTDVHATPLQHPHPDFHGPKADRTYAWSLQLSNGATCLHLFKMGVGPELLAHETGRAWYFRIFEPLRGEIL